MKRYVCLFNIFFYIIFATYILGMIAILERFNQGFMKDCKKLKMKLFYEIALGYTAAEFFFMYSLWRNI